MSLYRRIIVAFTDLTLKADQILKLAELIEHVRLAGKAIFYVQLLVVYSLDALVMIRYSWWDSVNLFWYNTGP